MKHPDNIKKVSALSPDYIGFIFYKKSPRYLTQIPENIPEGIKKTGVFVNEEYDQILDKVGLFNLQAVQLHGEESVELCKNLKHQNLEVIKAFSIDDDIDFEKIHSYQKVTDYFLFDTKGKKLWRQRTNFQLGDSSKIQPRSPIYFKWRNWFRKQRKNQKNK